MAGDLQRGMGSIEKNGNTWWYNVKLPGEKERRRIPLVPDGAGKATDDYAVALVLAKRIYLTALKKAQTGCDGTIAGLVRDYVNHARSEYKKGTEADTIERYLRPLVEACPMLPAEEFGPLKAQQIRQTVMERRRADGKSVYVRGEVNRHMKIWRRMFQWAVSQQRVSFGVLVGLQSIAPLKRGRYEGLRESAPVEPVDPVHVLAILDLTSTQVAAMLRLQLLTGMRPGEVTIMRPCDIDMSTLKGKGVWCYTPGHHKTEGYGHKRPVILGPQAQDVLAPFLAGRKADAYLFSPAEGETERLAKRHAARVTPMSCGNIPDSNRKANPERTPGDVYDTKAYNRAVTRAIEAVNKPRRKANVEREAKGLKPEPLMPHWHPHQIRHTKGTQVRDQYGLDHAQAVLGHASAKMAEHYAQVELAKAIEVARQTG